MYSHEHDAKIGRFHRPITITGFLSALFFMFFDINQNRGILWDAPILFIGWFFYSFGPAATRALPASLPSYLAKFLMKRPARSLAFSSHSARF